MPEHGVWSELAVCELRFSRDLSKADLVPQHRRHALKLRLERICASFVLPFEELDRDGCALSLSSVGCGEMPPKHVLQEESIIGHMRRAGMLQSPRSFLDLGCGRGCLSERLQSASTVSHHHVLVDRNPLKRARCRDFAMRKHGRVDRIVADLCDLDLRNLRLDSPVALSKHLCGPATDYALRCLERLGKSHYSKNAPIFIAPCCHHCAKWEAYTNPDWLLAHGFDETDFDHMCALSHWASLAVDEALDIANERCQDTLDSLLRRDKILLGKQCKLFLDIGRVQALKGRYANAMLVHYTTMSVENRLIIAYD